ncbi:3317_t:CDS:1, partial [Cetraspora pellucida]
MASNKSILISFVLFFSIFSPHVLTIPLSSETQKEPVSNVLPPNITEIKLEDLPNSGELYKLNENHPSDETDSGKTTTSSQPDSNNLSTESNKSPTTPQ